MKCYRYILVILLSELLTNCKGILPLIGVGKDGNTIVQNIDENKYQKTLQKSLSMIQQSVHESVDKETKSNQKWQLQLIVIGLNIKANIGVNSIFSVGAAPGIRVFFTNQGVPPPLP